MPTPEPPEKAETTGTPVTPEGGKVAADPWERMPEDALNRPGAAGAGEDREDEGASPAAGSPDGGGETGGGEAARAESWADFLPSPVFVLLLGLTGFAGWLSWQAVELDWAAEDTSVTPLIPPLMILLGWIVSCAVHEFAHALAAHLAGDRSLRGSAYLRLNPFAYQHAFAGLVLPVLYLGFGAFGMNGPAAQVSWDRIGPGRRVLVALAGPLANLVLFAALAGTVSFLVPAGQDTTNWAIAAMAFLAFANLTSALVNLLPVPGLDGFEVLAAAVGDRPWVRAARANALFGSVLVFAVLWFPSVHDKLVELVYALFHAVLPNPAFQGFAFLGELLLQFWNA